MERVKRRALYVVRRTLLVIFVLLYANASRLPMRDRAPGCAFLDDRRRLVSISLWTQT